MLRFRTTLLYTAMAVSTTLLLTTATMADDAGCCLPDGTCDAMTSAACHDAGGVYNPFLDCDEVACPVGACCLDEGNCEVLPQHVCFDMGGRYQGQGSDCTDTSCAAACVLESGDCLMASWSECLALDGVYLEYGSTCESVPLGVGSCCLPDDGCADLARYDCDLAGGVFLGTGSDCVNTVCQSVIVDASCESPSCTQDLAIELFDDGQGMRLLQQVSVNMSYLASAEIAVENRSSGIPSSGEVYFGSVGQLDLFGLVYHFGSDERIEFGPLSPEVAPIGDGADFVDFGTTMMSETVSEVLGDDLEQFNATDSATADALFVFSSSASVLANTNTRFRATNPRATLRLIVAYEYAQFGACCLPGGDCAELEFDTCIGAGGDYLGDGVSCVDGACVVEPTVGACCLTDGSCTVVERADCDSSGGAYMGDDVTCASAACEAEPVIGACCQADGSCVLMEAGACADAGGTYMGDDVSCGDAACEVEPVLGGCCLSDGQCAELEPADCAAAGGAYLGDGFSCADVVCNVTPETGACCLDDGTCVVLDAVGCSDSGGTYLGDNAACEAQACGAETTGACCYCPGDQCDEMTRSECDVLGGTFSPNRSCSDPGFVCKVTGACCFGPGLDECIAGLTELECSVYAGADFSPCQPCRGACLLDGEGCALMTVAQCQSNGWRFQGNCIACLPDQGNDGPLGACCLGDGGCFRVQQQTCEAIGGTFMGEGLFCWEFDCGVDADAVLGACCMPDSTCRQLRETDCVRSDGVWQGDGSSCSNGDCGSLMPLSGMDRMSMLLMVLEGWGQCPVGARCRGDFDADGDVGFSDLVIAMNQ